jgi:GTP cyclohydrolase I
VADQPRDRVQDVLELRRARAYDARAVEQSVRRILAAIGEDPEREGLLETPERVAAMYAELFSGVGRDPVDELDVVFDADHDEMIMVSDIAFASLCEHHLIPFIGRAHVAYVPNTKGQITGLSKLARVVDLLSKRPQVQERLTTQIADTLERALEPRGTLVVLQAEHLCMSMRGVKKPGTQTITSAVRGIFRTNTATRAEAMNLITRS